MQRSHRIRSLLLICLTITGTASAQGVQFFKGSWSQLQETARKEGKPIFVDVYTDWCPPCRQMDKEVFPSKETGDKYNPLFLNYRLNAEKGEGVEIAAKYAVKAYPTYLYLDPDGSLLHRAVGFFPVTDMIAQADKALGSQGGENTIGFLEKEFKSGRRDTAFLRNYIRRMTALGLDNNTVMNAYMEVLPVSTLATSGELLFLGENIFNARSNALVFLMAHYTALSASQKKQLANRLYARALYSAAATAWKEGRPVELRQILAYAEILEADLPAQLQASVYRWRLQYFGLVKDVTKLKETGYHMIGRMMDISQDSLRAEDARQYDQVMQPYRNGALDSTKIVSFEEEKKYFINQYSRKISTSLFEVATVFASTLEPGDAALADALKWAERAKGIVTPNPNLENLVRKLQGLVKMVP